MSVIKTEKTVEQAPALISDYIRGKGYVIHSKKYKDAIRRMKKCLEVVIDSQMRSKIEGVVEMIRYLIDEYNTKGDEKLKKKFESYKGISKQIYEGLEEGNSEWYVAQEVLEDHILFKVHHVSSKIDIATLDKAYKMICCL